MRVNEKSCYFIWRGRTGVIKCNVRLLHGEGGGGGGLIKILVVLF